MAGPIATNRARRTDHAGLAVLPLDECLFLLRSTSVGRLAFVHGEEVVILPVNHHVDGFDVYFRTAPGSKLDAARAAASAAFEVDGHDELLRGGWSVVAVGRVEETTEIERAHLRRAQVEPWADGIERDHWVVLRAQRVTGRMIQRETPPPVARLQPAHRSSIRHVGDDAQMMCTCGWVSRSVPAADPKAWDTAREEYREHVALAAAERVQD